MGGVRLYNLTPRPKFAAVFAYYWLPLPAGWYIDILWLPEINSNKWVPTGLGHAKVYAWDGTGDDEKDNCVLQTLRVIFIGFNLSKGAV